MDQSYMKEKPIVPLVLKMALPMVVSMLVNSMYNIVDSFFVAQIGEDVMTALSLVFPLQNLANAVGKMEMIGTENFGAYARKMLIDGYIIVVDYTEQKKLGKAKTRTERVYNAL